MSLTKSSHGLCDAAMNLETALPVFTTSGKKTCDDPLFRTPCMCLVGGRGVGTTPQGGSKLLDFLQTDPTPWWLLSSAAAAAAKCPHTLFGWDGLNLREAWPGAGAWICGCSFTRWAFNIQNKWGLFFGGGEGRWGGEAEKLKKVVLALQM